MKKDVEAFKRELGNYRYYRLNLEGTMELIEINEYNLSNLHGLDPSKQHVSSGVPWVESEEFKRVSKELAMLYERLELRKKQISYIEYVLGRLSKDTREACLQIYADRKTYSEVSRKMNISRKGLFYRIQKELDRVL